MKILGTELYIWILATFISTISVGISYSIYSFIRWGLK